MARTSPDPIYPRDQDVTSDLSAHERCRGDLFIGGGLRIRGVATGSITPMATDTTLIVAAGGHVEGDVQATRIRIDGTLRGRIEVEGHVEITAGAVVAADIIYGSISVAEGARVEGVLTRRYIEGMD